MQKLWKWVKILLIIYGVIGIGLYYAQDRFLFHPKKLPKDYAFPFPGRFEEVFIPVNSEDTIHLVKFLPKDTIRNGVVLYYHGNEKNVERYAPFTEIFKNHGYEVWMMDYPGFGKSTGDITERKLYDYAMQVYKLATINIGADSTIIYGKSLGTGIAAYIAAHTKVKMLILETPYYSIPDLLGIYAPIYPAKKMSKYTFPNYTFIPAVQEPIFIFEGTDDWVVPHESAEKLKPLLKPGDRFITIEGASHNNIYPLEIYQNTMDSLLRIGMK